MTGRGDECQGSREERPGEAPTPVTTKTSVYCSHVTASILDLNSFHQEHLVMRPYSMLELTITLPYLIDDSEDKLSTPRLTDVEECFPNYSKKWNNQQEKGEYKGRG